MGKNIKENNNKNTIIKTALLFIFLGIITVVLSASMAVRMFKNQPNINKKQTLVTNKVQNKVEDKEKHYETKGNSEDVVYLEKYLRQQAMGKVPDGADGKKVVYLTFDDGPSTTVTPYILNILKKEDIKATFFIVGQSLDSSSENKQILKREYAEGHSIGNHTYSHDYDYLYPNRDISIVNFMNDVDKTNKSMKKVLGDNFKTRVIRFPGGYTSWKDTDNISKYLNDRGYHYIDWNSLSKDSEGSSKNAEQLVQEIKDSVRNREKAVILMHDNYGKEETAKALPEIIRYLKDSGYEFKTIK